MNENNGWKKAINEQVSEIPVLEKMLTVAVHDTHPGTQEKLRSENHFNRQLLLQQKEMHKLNLEIDRQQERLEKDCENETENKYDFDTLCTQEILRERIKAIEKNYIDLKCNFMNYLSTLL